TPEACQDLVDHAAPSGYFSELRHMHNEDFLGQYNINLARQNLEALLETEAGIKRAAEEKSAGLSQELERMRAQFSKLQVSHERLSQQVDALQQQESREETLKAAFEDNKRQQDQMVEQRRAEIDARLDALSCAESLEMRQTFADVVSAGVAKGMSEGLKHGVEHGYAQRTVESLEAYDPEAKAKFATALQSLKDLKRPPESLGVQGRDWIGGCYCGEHQSCRTEKRNCIVCRTHGVGSAHHARSDRVPVSAPIVVPQGLALLLVDAATQTESDA
nr:hypothetical protein [Tanacetum cinerariifolium]